MTEAERLAHDLETRPGLRHTELNAAAELRRLEAENAALRSAPPVLTDERIDEIWDSYQDVPPSHFRDFVTRAVLAAAVPAGSVVVPVEPTPDIVSSIAQFLAKKSYLSHPNVPYHGTEEGDSPDAWHVRLLVALWKAAIAARPGACSGEEAE